MAAIRPRSLTGGLAAIVAIREPRLQGSRPSADPVAFAPAPFVGHDCDLPKPGNFFTVQMGD